MYSKSQQILLGIPHIHPTVLLAGDDFMFTPLLQPQHPPYGDEVEQMQFDYDEEEEEDEEEQEEDEEDDGENNPRDVLMVTARAPDVVDENTWMTGSLSDQQQQQQQLSQHQPQGLQMQMLSPGNQATAIAQHHVQAAARNDNNDADHQNNYSIQEEERHRPDTLEDTCEDVETGFTMSPEMIHWYRTARFSQARPPSTIFEFEDKGKEVQQQNTPDDGGEYQPLSEMLADDKNGSEHQQRTDSVVIPMPAQHHAYGTVKNREDIENEEDEEDEENDIATTGLAAFVGIMLDALHSVARDKDYQDGRGTLHQFWHFVGAVFHIWRLLFFCAETLLADLFAPVSYSRHTQPLQKLKIPPRHEV
ncbi:hypothetical protein BCR43DRAFT_483860 [Syncephalastrum racemosum]|uniref:Uncharacterized protein n=1 Tax=Syncephalastrum racemosum TaxID=13706 RepID=A0A1X2HVT8_SYNRA|nr:hypothetical protein BCR43DRAFT_483860 [Syncephalastrum racemosum]